MIWFKSILTLFSALLMAPALASWSDAGVQALSALTTVCTDPGRSFTSPAYEFTSAVNVATSRVCEVKNQYQCYMQHPHPLTWNNIPSRNSAILAPSCSSFGALMNG